MVRIVVGVLVTLLVLLSNERSTEAQPSKSAWDQPYQPTKHDWLQMRLFAEVSAAVSPNFSVSFRRGLGDRLSILIQVINRDHDWGLPMAHSLSAVQTIAAELSLRPPPITVSVHTSGRGAKIMRYDCTVPREATDGVVLPMHLKTICKQFNPPADKAR